MTLNRDPELRRWAKQWLKDKKRTLQTEMTNEEFEKHLIYVTPERIHEEAVEAVTGYLQSHQ